MATYNDRGLKLLRVETGASIVCEAGEFAIWNFTAITNGSSFNFNGMNQTGGGSSAGQSGPFFLKGSVSSPFAGTNCTVTACIYEDPS